MRIRSMGAAALLAIVAILVLVVTAEGGTVDGRLLFGLWHGREALLSLIFATCSLGFLAAAISREALLGFLFSLVLGCFSWVTLEVVGQTGMVSYAKLLGNPGDAARYNVAKRRAPGLDVRGEANQDTAYAWGLPHEKIPFHFLTDRYGFRNPSDPGSADVYLVGDSILVGGLVPFEETLTGRLAALTGRTVMNVALVGLSPQEEHQIFWDSELPLEGRVVLQFLFEGNDLLDSAGYRSAHAEEEARESAFDRSFVQNAVLAVQRWTQPVVGLASRRTCRIGDQEYTFMWTRESHAGVENEQQEILGAVAAFASRVEKAGGRFGLVYVPSKLRVLGPVCEAWPQESDLRDIYDEHPFPKTVRRFAQANRIRLVDLSDPLMEAAEHGEIPWFWGDTHWNERGHAVAARALVESTLLRERSPVAARP